jgi:endonuclease YncB( thermonuclease family)
MNHPRPSRPPIRRQTRPAARGFTPQQILVLILVAVLGSAALILSAFVLLSARPAGPSAAPAAQAGSGGPALPPTWTPLSDKAAPEALTATPAQSFPALPASCAQGGAGFSQGTVARVVDGSTVEVQVGENVQRIGYAGIAVPVESGPPGAQAAERAAQKAHELLDGQAVLLVKDVSDQDSAGRLARYVFAGGRFINFELVRQGLAVLQPDTPDQACAAYLQQAEQQARVEHLGLWKATPVPTRTFVPFVTLDLATQSACDCSKRYECSDFRTHAGAQTCFNACNDYSSKLDDDRDGIACENLP